MTQTIPAEKPSLIKRLYLWLGEPLVVLLLVFGTTTAIAQPFYVPSGSMQPTIAIGDALIGSKFAYGYSRYSLPLALGPALQTRSFGPVCPHGAMSRCSACRAIPVSLMSSA